MNNNNIQYDPMTGQPIQYQQQFQNTTYQQPIQQPNKKSNKKIIFILLIVIVVAILGFVGYNYFSKDKSTNGDFDLTKTTAFFLDNGQSKYALFNQEGKQLTEFIYTSTSSFVNGTAEVKIDDKEGIINSNGKEVVPVGKYKYIMQKGGLYEVTEYTDEHYKNYLIDSTGKILYDLEDIDVDDFIGVDTFSILEYEKEDKYVVINYEGKELASFPKVDDDDIEDPSVNEEDGYFSVFYNNKNWIFSAKAGKQIASFNSEYHYCVNNVSDDEKVITLNSCVGMWESQETTYYKFIKDGKLYDLTDKCEKVWFNEYSYGNNLLCNIEGIDYVLDKNLNVGPNKYGTAFSSDSSRYAKEADSFGGVDFYKDGKKIKNVPCKRINESGYKEADVVILWTSSSTCDTKYGTYEFYNYNGEKVIEKGFAKAEDFDKNGLAEVTDDKKSYYLIDKSGKQIGNKYDSIAFSSNYYIVTKNNLKGIMNKDGKEVVPCSYSRIEIISQNEKGYAKLTTEDSKYIVYDLDKQKELFSTTSSPNMNYEHYITVSNNGKTQYYTYSGKMFYEK